MSDKKPEKKKAITRAAAAVPTETGATKQEEETEMVTPIPADYEDFKNNVAFMFENIMGSLSLITSRLDNLEKKSSPAQSQKEDTNAEAHTSDSPAGKPDDTDLTGRLSERRVRASGNRERRYSTLEDLVSRREDSRRRLTFDEESEDEATSVLSRSHIDPMQEIKSKKPGKLFRELKSSKEVADARPVMVMRKEKECHITIEKFQLSKVAKAIRDILDFQEEEETTVRIQKVLSRNLKEHLRLVYNITHADLAKMDMADLFQIIARETRVYSTVAFYNELRESLAHVRIMDWSKVSAINHEVFYFQQLKLIDNFKRMLQIMLECNRKWCPRVDDKEYGLIRLFKSLNDASYVRYAFGCMSRLNFDSMGEFFEEYSATILDHYQVSLVTRELPYKGNQEHKERLRDYYERKRQLSQNQRGLSSSSSAKIHHVSHMSEEIFDSEEEEQALLPGRDAKTEVSIPKADEQYEDWGTDTLGVQEESDSAGEEVTKPSAESEFAEEQELHALVQQGKGAKTTPVKFGCLKKMLLGKCNKPNCPYSHNETTVLQSAREMREKIDAYIKSHSDVPRDRSQTPTLLRREHVGNSRA